MTENTKEDLLKWIAASLGNEDITNYTVEGLEKPEKGDGFMSDVLFVKVKGTKISDAKPTELSLVFKVNRPYLNNGEHEAPLYKREAFVYNQVFPEFRKFLFEKNVKNMLDFAPKYFNAINTEGKIVLILINLKSEGYQLHDHATPMNIQHIETVLRNYAKLHALSFAFKDQKKREFENLTANYDSMYKIPAKYGMKPVFEMGPNKSYEMLTKYDEDLAEKIKIHVVEKTAIHLLNEIFDTSVEESVITHGDCWNNNFMFKYKDNNMESPDKVAILDWQLSGMHSPMLDVAYFLFFVSSEEQVSRFDELLKYYHTSLSDFLTELGSDPKKLFPYTTMLKHWKQFSIVGLVFSLSFLGFLTLDKEDVVQMSDFHNDNDLIEALTAVKSKKIDLLAKRLISTSRYYFALVDK